MAKDAMLKKPTSSRNYSSSIGNGGKTVEECQTMIERSLKSKPFIHLFICWHHITGLLNLKLTLY